MSDSDYEHWPEDKEEMVPTSGYDEFNGQHTYTYVPAGYTKKHSPVKKGKKRSPASPEVKPQAPIAYGYPYPQFMPYPYVYAPQMVYPMSPYYGYTGYIPTGMPVPAPQQPTFTAETPTKKKEKTQERGPKHLKWQGRTASEIREDDMKMAAAEGAWGKRKVQPVGLADDQVVWVIDLDGNPVLRVYAAVKDLKGEWKADPRFEDAWYFVREA